MRPERVFFSSCPGRFRISCLRCDHIECPCTEVVFQLKEIPKRNSSRAGKRISIRVDAAEWRETDPPPRPPEIAAVVAEFLRDYPEHEREVLKGWYGERQRIRRRLDEYQMNPADIAEGLLIGFREILAPLDDQTWTCPLGEHVVECAGATYFVEERYCPNPACSCSDVRLLFRRCTLAGDVAEAVRATWQFEATISLEGEVALGTIHEGSPEEARLALAAWHKSALPKLKDLGWRFDKIREIGRRSLSAPSPPARSLPAPSSPDRRTAAALPGIGYSPRVGRNDPCPCGSGKKYKKCCARETAATST